MCLDDLHRLPAGGNTVVDELLQPAATEPALVALAYRPRQLGPALAALLSRAGAVGALWRAPSRGVGAATRVAAALAWGHALRTERPVTYNAYVGPALGLGVMSGSDDRGHLGIGPPS